MELQGTICCCGITTHRCVHSGISFQILQEMWKYYSVMDVLTVMSVSNFRFNDTAVDSAIPERNKPEIDIQLFSWFPYTSPTHCDKVKEAVLVDRWNSEGEFVLKVNLFPEKVQLMFYESNFFHQPTCSNGKFRQTLHRN